MKDSFNREINYLRVSVTDRCNLRCAYCMKEEGIKIKDHQDIISYENILTTIQMAAELGIHKVRITGGEPLVRKDMIPFLEKVSKIEGIDELCLTTNGILLKQYAKQLQQAHVHRINISLDTLNADKYKFITRKGKIEDVLEGIQIALSEFEQVKINVVYIKGFNDDEVFDFIDLTRKYPIDVRFIELMPIGEAKNWTYEAFNLEAVAKAVSLEKCPPEEGVATLYRVKNGLGRVGVIQAMSHSFCASCNRLRLTADGKIKPCLFSNQEFSVRNKSAEEIKNILISAIQQKPKSKDESIQTLRNMNEIGG